MFKMAKLADQIDRNGDFFKTLAKVGAVPSSVVRQKQIHTYWQGTKGGAMQRYQDTAEAMGTHVNTVMSAVKSMERNI